MEYIKIKNCRELDCYNHFTIIDYLDNLKIKKLYMRIRKYRAVKLTHRRHSDRYVIIHPCSKNLGKFQMSYFDEYGPSNDAIRDSVYELVSIVGLNYTVVSEVII